MKENIEKYKSFIDAFLGISVSSVSKWIAGDGFPDVEENESKNKFLATLSSEQKKIFAQIVQEAKHSGVHDALALLNEEQHRNDLRLIFGKQELPIEPFGTELHFDYMARLEGDDWPQS